MITGSLAYFARRISQQETTSRQLIEVALGADVPGAIERRIPGAIEAAEAADHRRSIGAALSSFDGIPFAVKANLDVAGIPTTAGTRLPISVAASNAKVVEGLCAAGLIPVVTTCLPELAIGAVTHNPHTGTCVNPRYSYLESGGSSGGSAAVVASGTVPLALGSDTMGSVRIPAAYCGIAGYKPTHGAISTQGLVALHPMLDTVGILANCVEDLKTVAGFLLTPPVVDDLISVIGVPTLLHRADEEGSAAVKSTVAALRNLGVDVRKVDLDFDPAIVRRFGLLLCEVAAYHSFRDAVEASDPGLSDRVRAMLAYGRDASVEKIIEADSHMLEFARQVSSVTSGVDAVLLSVTPSSVPRRGGDPTDAADFTAWVNGVGLPAVALPSGPSRHRPTGEPPRSVQIVGQRGNDYGLLDLASRVEGELLGP